VRNYDRVAYAWLAQEFAFHLKRLDTEPAELDLAPLATAMLEGAVSPPTAQIACTEERPAVGRIRQK
jgi:hypothetical protein